MAIFLSKENTYENWITALEFAGIKLKFKLVFGLNTNELAALVLFAISCGDVCCTWWLLLRNFLFGLASFCWAPNWKLKLPALGGVWFDEKSESGFVDCDGVLVEFSENCGNVDDAAVDAPNVFNTGWFVEREPKVDLLNKDGVLVVVCDVDVPNIFEDPNKGFDWDSFVEVNNGL